VNITKRSVHTYKVLQALSAAPVFVYGEFKKSRLKHGMSIARFEKCFGCNHAFADDEPVFFGCVEGKGNIFFCKECAEKYDTRKEVTPC
jgi:hypothetical protein